GWRVPLAALGLALALPLAACQQAAEAPPLAGATMGGPFTLTDQDGRRVSDRQFAGRYRIMYFGYSFCPDVCPTDLALIGAGLRRFEDRKSTRLNSSHVKISYAVFCLKKKKIKQTDHRKQL